MSMNLNDFVELRGMGGMGGAWLSPSQVPARDRLSAARMVSQRQKFGGMGDFVPGNVLASRPDSSIYGQPQMFGMGDFMSPSGIYGQQQMFGMGDFMPGGAFASRPDSSIYGQPQMFGMGQSDLTASIAQAEAELLKTKAERGEAQSRLAELKAMGATILRDFTGAITGASTGAKAGMSVGTMAMVAGGAYLVAKQMKWIK